MRVALVSTYPPAECGIGNYTRELRRALANDLSVTVLAERTVNGRDTDTGVTRCWDRRGNWVDELSARIESLAPDVVHVQHEESHYGQDARFIELLARARARGIRTMVTLHSVHDRMLPSPFRMTDRAFHNELARVCDVVVAHQHAGMADVLITHGVPRQQIAVIAHGTPTLQLPDRGYARAALDIPADAPTALFFGFIHFTKNLHVVIRAFEKVCVDLPNAKLLIAGRMRDAHVLDRLYAGVIRRLMRCGVERGQILYRPGFIRPEDKPLYFAATDLLLLPYGQRYGSASGVLHEGLAARRAIMCARGKKFAEAVACLGEAMPHVTPPPGDERAWEIGMERLLANAVERQQVVTQVQELATSTSWTASATQHANLYRGARVGTQRISGIRRP